MKTRFLLFAATFLLLAATRIHGQTLDWGSEVFSDISDSAGQTLDGTFVFEIGAFTNGFIPDQTNVNDWYANWQAFDQAAYNQSLGYFTSSVTMNDNGSSSYNPSALSFEGLTAFLWIRNDTNPVEGTEWLLTRADSWVFPTAIPGCCDNEGLVQWSVSDLTATNVPVWGKQGSVQGEGYFTDPNSHTLQTYTFIPEPSTALLATLAATTLLRRRRI